MTEDDSGLFDDTRRSLMKKGAAGAIAASGLAVGASGTTAAQTQGNVVLFSYDYYPNASFTVLAQMQQDAVSQILTNAGGGDQEGAQPFDDPFNWNGYIIQYDLGNGLVAFLFSEEANLSAGDSATTGENAAFRSGQFIETSIGGGSQ